MQLTLLAIDWGFIIEKLILIISIVSISLVIAMYETYAERKVAAVMQDRRGPNRAGPFGILQPLADGLKLFMKEEIIPNTSNKFLFVLGPCMAMLTAMMTSAVIPWGGTVELFGRNISLQIADINIGILYIFGVVSMKNIVEQQMAPGHWWNVFYQPLGFLIFLVCAFAECNRTPFDLPEAENELNFGYHQEYSSMKLGFYLFAEYINMFISSVIMATLFFGGYDMPFFDEAAHAHWGNWLAVIGMLALT